MSRDQNWWEDQDRDDAWIKQQEEELQRYDEESDEPLYADGFDDALIGLGVQFNQRVAIYDYDKCLDILEKSGMPPEDAIEYMEYNVLGAYMGRRTPVFLSKYIERKPKRVRSQITGQLELDFGDKR